MTVDWRGRLGEASVIVGSILLAFAIDAAWDARMERTQEAAVLSAIRDDMAANLRESDRVLRAREFADESLEVFLEGTPEALDALPSDSAGAVFNGLTVAATFTSFQGSLSATNLGLVRDLELRTELGAWIGQAADVAETGPFLIEGNQALEELASPAGAIRARAAAIGMMSGGDPANVVLGRLREDVRFVDAALRFDRVRSINTTKLLQLRETTEHILTRLGG